MIGISLHIDIILPIALLFLTYTLRLFIDRSVDGFEFLKSLCEFTVDIVFLSLSFIIAYTVTHKEHQAEGLLYFIIYLILAVIVVFIRRRSIKLLEIRNWCWVLLFVLNIAISVTAIFGSISLFTDDVGKGTTDNPTKQLENGH